MILPGKFTPFVHTGNQNPAQTGQLSKGPALPASADPFLLSDSLILLRLPQQTPQTSRRREHEFIFLAVLEAGSLRSECQSDSFLSRTCSWLADGCVQAVSSQRDRASSLVLFHVRALNPHSFTCPTLMTSSEPNYSTNSHLQSAITLGARARASTQEFWVGHNLANSSEIRRGGF